MMDAVWRRVAAYVVCRDDEARVLLTRVALPGLPDDGKWTMPGGGMEWGEHPAATGLRELTEETGLHGRMGPVLGVFSRWFEAEESFRGEPGHVVGIVFEATDLTGDLRTAFDDGTTTSGAAWFSLDEVQALDRVELVDFVLGLIVRE